MASIKRKDDLCAIFVHAGAGFHSRENEKAHLDVCAQATTSAMTFLRGGGSAVEAVEVAIMVLEDAPLTNAGYGSNLTERGRVEGDATIVDHHGRSGAVGAVPNIKNPIALARKVYERAHQSPGLSRVPPNLLVGEGATDFAWENGIPVVPDDDLISANSRARWRTWCQDLADYEKNNPPPAKDNGWLRRPLTPLATRIARADLARAQEKIEAQLAATRQLDPVCLDPHQAGKSKELDGPMAKAKWIHRRSLQPFVETSSSADSNDSVPRAETQQSSTIDTPMQDTGTDTITDTVGAIAIDMYGNIAAGSSSGGIGMKHRGRVGPAALIGIGTHVMPVDPTDPERATVAAVCSGTGEHIASTFAANTCAMRLFFSQRKGEAGIYEPVTEEEAIQSMIIREFIGHPAVENSEVVGSIGIMAAKKTEDGICLYFAHNTESFAMASMSSNDPQPVCLMSRNPKMGSVAQGGLMLRPQCFYNGMKRKKHKTQDESE